MDSNAPPPSGMSACLALLAQRAERVRCYAALLARLAEMAATYTELTVRVQHLSAFVTEGYTTARRRGSLDEQDPSGATTDHDQRPGPRRCKERRSP